TIVTLSGSFHGRTITMLSATGQEKFHKDFDPFTPGFVHIQPGDVDALDKALDAKTTAGFFIEAIQGESGIVPQTQEFIEAAAKLCAERDILFMFDEIQCGMGRTGTFLGLEQFKDSQGSPVQADIVTLAKGLAGGIPMGAVLAGGKTSDVFCHGDHGSTFGGNPIAAAAAEVVLETVNTPEFLQENKRKGDFIKNALSSLPKVKAVRGMGLMIGFDIEDNAWSVVEKAIARAHSEAANDKIGLLLLTAGANTLRLLPPYILTDDEICQGLEIIAELLR
ncbi:MAG: aminotransferase class III-fold pyridoxal phosphate-dependent enzyme, partial [Treponema sp.]|nr:aminotransferase class III-fold pyridoxal phosphate-dependent enzyme [Treponema sp.]